MTLVPLKGRDERPQMNFITVQHEESGMPFLRATHGDVVAYVLNQMGEICKKYQWDRGC